MPKKKLSQAWVGVRENKNKKKTHKQKKKKPFSSSAEMTRLRAGLGAYYRFPVDAGLMQGPDHVTDGGFFTWLRDLIGGQFWVVA